AFLNKGLEIVVHDERPVADEVLEAVRDETVPGHVDEGAADSIHQGEAGGIEQTFRYDRGLVDFVEYLNRRKTLANPTVISFEAEQSAGVQGSTQDLSLEVAMQWNVSLTVSVYTSVNI